ncbi:MAG: hypothetical protein Q4B28_00405 [bacterium]|nr:hypothetical protein [bacterium]
MEANASQNQVFELVKADEKLASYLTGEVKKLIYVPGKIINLIVG